MNSLPRFVYALGVLGSLFLFSPTCATAQQMSEAQRRERCENNQKMLADIDRQLKAVETKLNSTMNDEELARAVAQRNFTWNILQQGFNRRPAVKEEQVAKLEELSTLSEFDEQKSCPQGFKAYNSDCVSRLHAHLATRIERAEQANLQKKELSEQRTQLQEQRSVHENRLAELGCDTSARTPPAENGCTGFAGTWKTTFGTMTFERRGNQIVSSYDFDGGSIRGTISGDGRTLTGTYSEVSAKGTFRFSLAADGKSFSGNWNRTSGTRNPPRGVWSGECTSP